MSRSAEDAGARSTFSKTLSLAHERFSGARDLVHPIHVLARLLSASAVDGTLSIF